MFDLTAFLSRVWGMLLQPMATLVHHGRPAPPWGVVLREHALPLSLITAVLSAVLLGLTMPADAAPRFDLLLLNAALGTISKLVMLSIMAGVVMVYSGMFGGSSSYDASYVLVTLAMTPQLVAEALLPVPLVGLLAGLAALVYSLSILYRGLPLIIALPVERRGRHFALTLVTMLTISLTLFAVLIRTLLPETAGG